MQKLKKLHVVELRNELATLGLSTDGVQAVLAKRVEDAIVV